MKTHIHVAHPEAKAFPNPGPIGGILRLFRLDPTRFRRGPGVRLKPPEGCDPIVVKPA